MGREQELRSALESALGHPIHDLHLESAAGGCINRASLLLADKERFFVKYNDRPLPDQFAAETAALKALASSGSSLLIPRPIAFSDAGPGRSFLVLEYLEAGRRGPDFAIALGRGLAELHCASTDRGFGFEIDGYCGATPQPNGWMDSWTEFYATRRLGHQLRLARDQGLDAASCQRLERLIDRLGEWISDDEPPALLHGDLWSGNLYVGPGGRPALVDPAAYYGHREAELGMMALFGGFESEVWQAYHDARPLRKGWRGRLDLYSLYHLLNHFHLFGGSYAEQAMTIVRHYAG